MSHVLDRSRGLWLPSELTSRRRRSGEPRVLTGKDALNHWESKGWYSDEGGARWMPPMAGGSVPGSGYTITHTATALGASTAKTCMGFASGTSDINHIPEFGVMGDATSGNILVELVYGTNATNAPGTASTSFTPLLFRGPGAAGATPAATAAVVWTTEPTVLTVVKRWRFAWPGGPFVIQFPMGREPNTQLGSASGRFIGIRNTSSVAVTNCDGYMEIEE